MKRMMNTKDKQRPCFICNGEGKLELYGDDDETVIGHEDCYQCGAWE